LSGAMSGAVSLHATVLPQPQRGGEVEVHWRGKAHPAPRLPEEVAPAARAAVAAWADLAQREGWRLDLEAEGRVLLITPRRGSKVPRYLRLVEQVVVEVDSVFPAPERSVVGRPLTPAGRAAAADEIPEDPEEPPVDPIEGAYEPPSAWTWGSAERAFDRDTAVLFVLRDEAGVEPILARLAQLHGYLEPWIPSARKLAGWSLELPLVGLCYESPSGVEEWQVENELVHRLAELLTLRRFGPQPQWLIQGFAWSVEMRLMKSIYCFPGRAGFVWASEHTSWPSDLRRRFAEQQDRPLAMEELDVLRRGSHSDVGAPLAWGFFEFLRQQQGPKLSALADALRAHRDRENRVDLGGGDWSREREYRVPSAVQRALLLEHLGPTVLAEAPRFLARIR
jgi:hypothetical protein